ncbi:hypothetical protein KY290_008678 [Solanum tuberosum]|uniref:Secreted protein n=1 Tax=Solanum tuberosum TaxID=4113 RepID=A0ABQ7W974_SOLTU|nr:hypothetical protein KY290_008678 [Solanum tuberosum]
MSSLLLLSVLSTINALEGSLVGRGPLGNETSQHQSGGAAPDSFNLLLIVKSHIRGRRQEDGDSPSLLSSSPIISASDFY